MERLSILVCALLVIGTWTVAAGPSDDARERTRIIVGFDEWPGLEPGDDYNGFEVVDVSEDLEFAVVEASGLAEVQRTAIRDDRVQYVERDHRNWELSFVPDDGRYADQYGPQITNTESAWDTTLGSTSVKLGLLDTGITADHEDFVNSRVSGHDYVNGDGTPEDAGNCGYHGSHTSGTAAATTNNGVGIAGMSESSIIMHKIFDKGGFFGCGATSTSNIADALKDLGDKGAHISSNSWGGGGESTTLNNAIDYAHNKGTIHVAAAGNDGSCTDCISEPWASRPDKVVIVTCSDENDGFCSFSSQGPEADLIAPGSSVLSVDGGDLDGYTNKDGTSMSTPHVSGAIGLYIAANGDASFSTIETALKDSADDLGLSTNRQGGGRLNTGSFVASGDGGGTNSAPTANFTASCTDLNCTFDASNSSDSDGNITSYDWEFGDGTTGTGEIVDHTYAESGSYTVNLTVTDDDNATDTESKTIQVGNAAPSADFTASCTDLNCTFDGSGSSDSDGTIQSFDWEFGDGTTGTGEVVDHTYAEAGDYTVNLTVTDDDGATDTTSKVVSVTSGAGGIHSGDLDGASSNQGSTWTATVTITVHDADHNAESGSDVTFDYTGRDVGGTVSCTSGTDGTCSVSVSNIPKRTGSVDFTVTDIADADGSYDSASNHDPDGDSDGTTITVTKP